MNLAYLNLTDQLSIGPTMAQRWYDRERGDQQPHRQIVTRQRRQEIAGLEQNEKKKTSSILLLRLHHLI
jgi:hypothetical protein